MSEFLLELYSEEIPPFLQINARNQLKDILKKNLEEQNVKFKECLNFSTPTRLAIYIKGLPISIKVRSKEIKGPKFEYHQIFYKALLRHTVLVRKTYLKKRQTRRILFYKDPRKKNFNKRFVN